MKRLARTLDALARTIGAIGIAALAGIVAWVVFSRYVLGVTPRWSEELPRLILVWVTFLGVVSGFARGSHFEAGIADMILGQGPLRRAARWLALFASAAFLVVLLVTGWQITGFTWHHATTALALPGGLFYLCLPIGAALSLVALVAGRFGK
ncbi:TRAP transporter small permease [Paracoccus sp. MBLB3053]|uniref:TRAP transporter small permease protein n=1 Tax=Paracoccus aurantius TaxID=3073814 RepID=A0ABU2HWR8_9RHOB|nr:TRAP transporter small permease [Paracoccus sp. MBLB3053]MDS9469010.1 TRAP transporter small permease [Paracoccus sp. MBLB3053]